MKKWWISLATAGTAVSTPVTVVKVLMDNNYDFKGKDVSFAFKKILIWVVKNSKRPFQSLMI